jgi:hypothetical protein
VLRTLWTLTNRTRTASAHLCEHPLGFELRIVEGSDDLKAIAGSSGHRRGGAGCARHVPPAEGARMDRVLDRRRDAEDAHR